MFKSKDHASRAERDAAQSFKEKVAEYNRVLADEGQESADAYGVVETAAWYAQYRKARR